ncbi:MAG: TonB-dependent receptor, partial [Methylophilus sp.]
KISDYISSIKNTNFVAPAGYILAPRGDGKPIYPETFTNQGSVTLQGFETQLKWDISNTSKLLANYAHTVVSSNVPGKEGQQIPNSAPKNTTSLLFTQQFENDWNASLAAYFTSSVNALSDGTQVKANQRYDARVAKKFNWDKMRGEMSVNVQNLTDRHYHEFAQYNSLRRRAYLNVSLDF